MTAVILVAAALLALRPRICLKQLPALARRGPTSQNR
jgi:hypothetical protein